MLLITGMKSRFKVAINGWPIQKFPIFLSPPAFNWLQSSRLQLVSLFLFRNRTKLTSWISYNGCICIFDKHTGWNYWHKENASHGRNQISHTARVPGLKREEANLSRVLTEHKTIVDRRAATVIKLVDHEITICQGSLRSTRGGRG